MTETYTAEQRAIMQLQLKLGASEERVKDATEFWDSAMSQSVGLRYDYATKVITNERAEAAEERIAALVKLNQPLMNENERLEKELEAAEAALSAIRDAPIPEMPRRAWIPVQFEGEVTSVPRWMYVAADVDPVIIALTQQVAALKAENACLLFNEGKPRYSLHETEDKIRHLQAENAQLKAHAKETK